MAETNFFWDPLSDNILQERDETGAVTAEYTAEPGLHGNIISQNRGGVESQFHFDAQGNLIAVTVDDQNVTDRLAYSAFGEITERTGTTQLPFQFLGQNGYYLDSVSGQYLVRRRFLDTETGRWLSVDPLGVRVGDENWFIYARNRPLVLIDPSGLGCKVFYDCVLLSQEKKSFGVTCFCEYRCVESTTKARQTVSGIGGVDCEDPRIAKNIPYSLSQLQACKKFVPDVPKIYTETREAIRDCSRKGCRDAAAKVFDELKKSCKLVPEGGEGVCEAADDLWLTNAKFVCEGCNKP